MCFNKVVVRLFVMSLMAFLPSSSFFLPDYLSKKLVDGNYSTAEYNFSLLHNYTEALIIQAENNDAGSKNWVSANNKLGQYKEESALTLGKWYQKQWHNHQLVNEPNSRTKEGYFYSATSWFEQAISLGSTEASLLLAKLHYDNKNFVQAEKTLNSNPNLLPSKKLQPLKLVLQLKLAIYFGDVELIEQLMSSSISAINDKEVEHFYNDILKYNITKVEAFQNQPSLKLMTEQRIEENLHPSCIASLQLFGTSFEDLQHIEKLIKTFKAQQVLSKYICLPTPRYVSKKRIQCEAKENSPITCNEALWQNVADDVTSRFVGLMLEQGGANVHLGVLYFDTEDDHNVLSHEISHLLGFIDEYPLSKQHHICQAVQEKPFSHNVVILKQYYQGDRIQLREMILKSIPWAEQIDINTPILMADNRVNRQYHWRLGTPKSTQNQLGVYSSETCESINVKASQAEIETKGFAAFKPLQRRTQLRYNESSFPKEYIKMLNRRPSAYLMPSYQYNIALSLFQGGDVKKAKYWLEKSAAWEIEPVKKATILTGGY